MIGLVARVLGVEELPEGVVHPVESDLDHHEEVPRPGVEQVPADGEALLGHLVDLREDAVALLVAKVAHVHPVGADHRLDLGAQGGWKCVRVLARVGGQKARHELAVDRHRRRGLRHSDHDHVLPARDK